MKKHTVIPMIAFLLGATSAVRGADAPSAAGGRLRITCTTTLLSAVVNAVGGAKVDVHAIVPFGMCPGHFDLTPDEAYRLRNADILFCHGFERFLKGIDTGSKTQNITAQVKGNWMIPTIHTQAVENIRAVLTDAMPDSQAFFADRAQVYSRSVIETAGVYLNPLSLFQGSPVVCAVMSRELAESMGFRVVAEFARDEDVSVKALHQILTRAEEEGAVLVIDNMQSSGKIGRTIANELGVSFVMLSNFPAVNAAAGQSPYLAALSNNYASVLRALETDRKNE